MSIVHIAFYPSDWLAGTRGMSDTETGVYITLICRMYEMAGPIERDDNRLYRLCGSSSKVSFLKSLNYLIDEGKIIETADGLINEKVTKVLNITVAKSSKSRAAAQSRWDRKPNNNKGGGDADASLEHMPQLCHPDPDPKKGAADASLSFALQSDEPDQVQIAIDLFKAAAEKRNWPIPRILTKARKSAMAARLKECGGIEGWKVALKKAQASSHCNGGNSRGWVLDFDFITRQSSFAKLMEGNYDNRDGKTNGTGLGRGMATGATPEKIADFAARYVASKQAGR